MVANVYPEYRIYWRDTLRIEFSVLFTFTLKEKTCRAQLLRSLLCVFSHKNLLYEGVYLVVCQITANNVIDTDTKR